MALDKLVDSTQLNTDLTSIANAIRAKSGGGSQLAFPAGFVSEIGNIPSGGGGDNLAALLDGSLSGEYENSDITTLKSFAVSYCPNLTGISFPNVTSITNNCIYICTGLTRVSMPKLRNGSNYCMAGLTALTAIALPNLQYVAFFMFSGNQALASADFGTDCSSLGGQGFVNCSALKTLILRRSTGLVSVAANTFNGTPLASGGSGCTVYIPKALYDHLGDGSNLDYRVATNWSVLNGYGTITWLPIEGSIYETQYADGTHVA